MSDFLLLSNPKVCPSCRARRPAQDGNCRNCGMRLFVRPSNFKAYESETGNREWWLFNTQLGWMHRSQIMMGVNPLSRTVEINQIVPNTKTAREQINDLGLKSKVSQILH